MDILRIEATSCSPLIDFDPAGGQLRIEGESYPENSFDFYAPVFSWLEEYLKNPAPEVVLDIGLSYLNTSSIKCMIDVLEMLDGAHQNGRTVSVRWHYDSDNDRALDMAEEFAEDVSLPFEILAH
ncbi:biofilm regulation phosphoprotein SiaC [Azospirillum sp. B506]|uniref:biofilm regulation phosphoprotein SiaC n=1 Tax=Azospirillum sp. B506 TaxID=137721 RepID=UPI00034608ED|nr:biofilm regulation phosphoprotein SiaC [Azospirillum sp. B506]